MKFFKRKYYGEYGLRKRFREQWDNAILAYNHHLESMWPLLPEWAKALHSHEKRHPLHDHRIEAISCPDRDQLSIELDDRRLDFAGVRHYSFSGEELPSIWLYSEIDEASGDACELRVLLNQGELQVVAVRLAIYDKRLHRYVVPEGVPREAPTLFADRLKGKKRRG